LGYVSCGTIVAWSSNSLGKLEAKGIITDAYDQTILASIAALAAAISSILAYKFYFYIGTKRFMVLSAASFIASCYLVSFW
jgi:hypothetical protein